MQRTRKVLLMVALFIGGAVMVGLGITVVQQRSELQSRNAKLNPSPSVTPIVIASPSPTPTLNAAATTAPPSPVPSAPKLLLKVTDNLGHSWTSNSASELAIAVAVGTTLQFNSAGHDPMNRPLEYLYFNGNRPYEPETLCNWGGASCTWTVHGPPGDHTLLWVAVRVQGVSPYKAPCYASGLDGCDELWLLANISAS